MPSFSFAAALASNARAALARPAPARSSRELGEAPDDAAARQPAADRELQGDAETEADLPAPANSRRH